MYRDLQLIVRKYCAIQFGLHLIMSGVMRIYKKDNPPNFGDSRMEKILGFV
jgi:hypothetical protein